MSFVSPTKPFVHRNIFIGRISDLRELTDHAKRLTVIANGLFETSYRRVARSMLHQVTSLRPLHSQLQHRRCSSLKSFFK
jgi:hypothetical protein